MCRSWSNSSIEVAVTTDAAVGATMKAAPVRTDEASVAASGQEREQHRFTDPLVSSGVRRLRALGGLIAVPLAWLGTVTPLGRTALLLALLAESGAPMVVNTPRFRTNAWKEISRSYRPEADASD